MSFKRFFAKFLADVTVDALSNKNNKNDDILDYSNYAELWWDDFAPYYNDVVNGINNLGLLYDLGDYTEDDLSRAIANTLDLYEEYLEVSSGTILKGFDDSVTKGMVEIDNICTSLTIGKANPQKIMDQLFG